MVLLLTSYLFYYILSETVEEQIGKRALHVAKTVAAIPKFRKLFKRKSSFYYSANRRKIQMDTEADFIVVGNKEGIRYAHPERDKIGEKWLAEIIKAFY